MAAGISAKARTTSAASRAIGPAGSAAGSPGGSRRLRARSARNDEAQEAGGEEARPARREREPERNARGGHRAHAQTSRPRGAQHEQRREQLEEHGEHVGHGDPALDQEDPVAEQERRREDGGTFASQHPAREQQEDTGERRSGERGGESPGPRVIAEEVHADRDQQLRGGRVHPFRRRLAVQVLERRLGVVDLVEVLLGRIAEPGQAEDGRHEQHQEQRAARPEEPQRAPRP